MDYRQYDSAIGRFNSIDALSELDYDKSPYAFARNSPVAFNEPTGLCPECEDYSKWRSITRQANKIALHQKSIPIPSRRFL